MKTIDKLKESKNPIISCWAKVWDSFSYKKVSVPFKSNRLTIIIGLEKDTGLEIVLRIERIWHMIPLTYVYLEVTDGNEECLKVSYSSFQKEYRYEKNSDLPMLKKIYDEIPNLC